MVKFEGYAGLKLDWLLDRLSEALHIDQTLTKKLLIDALFELSEFDELLDCMVEMLTKTTASQTVGTVIDAALREQGDAE